MNPNVKRAWQAALIASLVAGNVALAAPTLRNALSDGQEDACIGDCRCFSSAYCTEWPTGDTCKTSGDCD